MYLQIAGQNWQKKLSLKNFKKFKFIKKETPTMVFSSESYEVFKNTFFIEQNRQCIWLL